MSIESPDFLAPLRDDPQSQGESILQLLDEDAPLELLHHAEHGLLQTNLSLIQLQNPETTLTGVQSHGHKRFHADL